MNISEFISNFRNHPILFVGTGMSLRYLKNSYTWDDLLKKAAYDLKENEEYYLDLKGKCYESGEYQYAKIASILEKEYTELLEHDRNGKFKDINDKFYENMANDIHISRFKIYISKLLSEMQINDDKNDELQALIRIRKNISSVITTNYDKLIEEVFSFTPLIGNDILLSNQYGAVYKIHGCVDKADKIIITEEDYIDFDQKYELIRAQLLSLFIHNPIIFIGYSISDENIKKILKTIFTYVDYNSEKAEIIRNNFLLVEYEENSDNSEVIEHDIDIEGCSTIRINKIKTDNFIQIYDALSSLQLPVSTMDIRKVQNIMKEIYTGGEIKVNITEDLDDLDNKDKVLVIGSMKTIKYEYQTTTEMMVNYFDIIEESNAQLLSLIDKQKIQNNQYFPIYGFSIINPNVECTETLKKNQKKKLETLMTDIESKKQRLINNHKSITDIIEDDTISSTNKTEAIIYSVLKSQIDLKEFEEFLKKYDNKKITQYRKLLCAYDYMKYGGVRE